MVYVEDIPGDRVQVLGESNVLDRQQVNDEFTCQGGCYVSSCQRRYNNG